MTNDQRENAVFVWMVVILVVLAAYGLGRIAAEPETRVSSQVVSCFDDVDYGCDEWRDDSVIGHEG